jgi:hypothetical protein
MARVVVLWGRGKGRGQVLLALEFDRGICSSARWQGTLEVNKTESCHVSCVNL